MARLRALVTLRVPARASASIPPRECRAAWRSTTRSWTTRRHRPVSTRTPYEQRRGRAVLAGSARTGATGRCPVVPRFGPGRLHLQRADGTVVRPLRAQADASEHARQEAG